MINVLSSKKLTSKQHGLLLGSNILLAEYNAIKIKKRLNLGRLQADNAIVTSQNSAKILIHSKAKLGNVFCVGSKTSALLTDNNYHVVKTCNSAFLLANYIVKKHNKDSFVFFCGNKRREDLPNLLVENEVCFSEKTIYNTELNVQKHTTCFKAILFFSPSAVTSYLHSNTLGKTIAFCIGESTAKEAQQNALKTVVSKEATIESTIELLIRYFKV